MQLLTLLLLTATLLAHASRAAITSGHDGELEVIGVPEEEYDGSGDWYEIDVPGDSNLEWQAVELPRDNETEGYRLDFFTRRQYLKSPDSFVRLSSEQWRVERDGETIVVAVRFTTRAASGTMLRLRASSPHDDATIFELVIGLKDSNLEVDMLDGTGESMIMKPFTIYTFRDAGEHSVGVRLGAASRSLVYSAETDSEMAAEIKEVVSIAGSRLEVTLGSTDGHSLPGCITLVSVTLGQPLPDAVHTDGEYDVESCAEHAHECDTRHCGEGHCLELETATCDCYGTGRAGPNCRDDPYTVAVSATMDDAVRYVPLEGADQLPSLIALNFAFDDSSPSSSSSPTTEGVLVSARLSSADTLTIFVVDDGNGSLQIGDETKLNFALNRELKEHSLLLLLNQTSSSLVLTIDDVGQTLAAVCPEGAQPARRHIATRRHGEQSVAEAEYAKLWYELGRPHARRMRRNSGGSSCSLRIEEVHFGAPASAEKSGARRVTLAGCLLSAYVDHHDVLAMYYDGDPRVRSTQQLHPCGAPDAEAESEAAEPPRLVLGGGLFMHRLSPERLVSADSPDAAAEEQEVKHGNLFPAPAKKKSPSPLSPCENSLKHRCRNGGRCLAAVGAAARVGADDGGGFVCQCAAGYAGRYCQFSTLPRTCAEAADLHRLPAGPTRIDVDGSESAAPSVAACKDGWTTVINDMPNATVVHDQQLQHSQFFLSYRDFLPYQLERLIAASAYCEQAIRYECHRSPLSFATRKTQFVVVNGNRSIVHIGGREGECPCAQTKQGCLGGGRCNCDAATPSAIDEGVLTSPLVGVTRLIAFRDQEKLQNSAVTIGSLRCRGYEGDNFSVRFSSSEGRVTLSTQYTFTNRLSFHFRTSSEQGTLLDSVRAARYLSIKLKLTSAHTLVAELTNGAVFHDVIVESPIKLNDTRWHGVLLEVAEGELRLSVDDVTAVQPLTTDGLPLPDRQPAVFGGFVGCLRAVLVDGVGVPVFSQDKTTDVHTGCADRCEGNICQNEAECVQDFIEDTASCVCRQPETHLGNNCEIDINENSAVSFHGGHLRYDDLAGNPLTGQLVVSFRTDQQQALVLFAHDHLNNFLQVHLASEIAMVLTLNNDDQADSCTVNAAPGREFSDMQWIQVIISHDALSSTLSVNGRACMIHAKRRLATSVVTHFTTSIDDIVTIPVGLQQSAVAPEPFMYTFVGGVKVMAKPDGHKHLVPVYQSTIPDLLGCVRGLRVGGGVVDLRYTTKGVRPDDQDLVRPGCSLGCASLACAHGGHCGVDWLNFAPSFGGSKKKTRCECARTSYAGETCTEDDGLSLVGGLSVKVAVHKELARYLGVVRDRPQSLRLAFKVNEKPTMRQTIVSVFFQNDTALFEVLLNRNGSVNVAIRQADHPIQVRTFEGNFADGFRHFFVAQFRHSDATAVQIDAARHDFAFVSTGAASSSAGIGSGAAPSGGRAANLDLFAAESIVLGQPLDARVTEAERAPFDGCVSNVEVDYAVSQLRLRPLSDLMSSRRDATHSSYVSVLPENADVTFRPCGEFEQPNILPGCNRCIRCIHDPWMLGGTVLERKETNSATGFSNGFLVLMSLTPKVEFPAWETNFGRLAYTGASWPIVDEPSGGFPWWIIIVLLLLALLVAAGLLVYCLCIKPKQPEKKPVPKDVKEHELKPLNPSTPVKPVKPHSNFDIPMPDVPLDKADKRQVSHGKSSVGRSSDAYFTAPEYPSDSESERVIDYDDETDWDRTLTTEDGALQRPEDLEAALAEHTLVRAAPARLSSFRAADPTAPVGSPLRREGSVVSGAAAPPRRSPRPVPPPRLMGASASASPATTPTK